AIQVRLATRIDSRVVIDPHHDSTLRHGDLLYPAAQLLRWMRVNSGLYTEPNALPQSLTPRCCSTLCTKSSGSLRSQHESSNCAVSTNERKRRASFLSHQTSGHNA